MGAKPSSTPVVRRLPLRVHGGPDATNNKRVRILFRVTVTHMQDVTSFALEGRLAGEWIAALKGALESHAATGRPLRCNLAGLTFIDVAGAALLRELARDGVSMVGASPFVATLMAGSE